MTSPSVGKAQPTSVVARSRCRWAVPWPLAGTCLRHVQLVGSGWPRPWTAGCHPSRGHDVRPLSVTRIRYVTRTVRSQVATSST